MDRLAVVIVNYRTVEFTIECILALGPAREAFADLTAIVVDGGSRDGSAATIRAMIDHEGLGHWVRLIALDLNGGFAFANNRALLTLAERAVPPQAIALINPDARVLPGALEAMAALLDSKPEAGAVGALLVHEDGRPQASAFRFPSLRSEFCRGAQTGAIDRLLGNQTIDISALAACEVPWVTGAAVMFRTAALERIGLFDEGFFLYFEETELMHRLRASGWSIWHEPAARVVHAGGAATQIRDPESGQPQGRRMPAYWYRSRRRYFALTGGVGRVLAANLLWLAGHGLWLARSLLTGARSSGPSRIARDLWANGFWPSQRDATPAISVFDAAPAAEPAWRSNQR